MLERLPANLEEQALLWIHPLCFTWRYLEEPWIELVDVADEAASARCDATDRRRVRIVEGFMIPSLGRHRRDGIDPIGHELPEARRIVAAARYPAAKTDDGDRLMCCLRDGGKASLGLLEREEGTLER